MRLPLAITLLGALGVWALPAPGQEAVATACPPKRFVEGWLRSEGYHLDNWGLMGGRLHELWQGPRGWAIVETQTDGCARIVSLPDAPRERTGGVAG